MRQHISSDGAHRIAFGFSPPDDRYFATRLRDGLANGARAPPVKDRAAAAGLASSGSGHFGTCRGERKANAVRGLDHTGADFQEPKTQRRELGNGRFSDLWEWPRPEVFPSGPRICDLSRVNLKFATLSLRSFNAN